MPQRRIETCSVAMTTFRTNTEFLQQQLNSIRDQKRTVDQVVIVDDKSGDCTVNFLQSYITENNLDGWTIIENEKNRGIGYSFNTAVSACTGDLIFLCDHDDIWNSDKVASYIEVFDNHPEIHCLLGNYYLINEHSKRITTDRQGDNLFFNSWKKKIDKDLYYIPATSCLAKNSAPGTTQAFTRDCIPGYLSSKGHYRMHDWKIDLVACLQFSGLYYYNKPLTNYRQHSNNEMGVNFMRVKLPERKGMLNTLSWKWDSLQLVMQSTWEERHRKYGWQTHFCFPRNSMRDNTKGDIQKYYLSRFEMSASAKREFAQWNSYQRAFSRAKATHSFLRFIKLRIKHRQCHKDHFQYDTLLDRFACLLRDFYYCTFGKNPEN